MELIQWSDKISVNNTRIDNQHKKLIELVNNLILNSNAKANSEIINETLSELLKYTRYHFKDEEELMELRQYPKLDSHREIHKEFVYKITLFCKDVTEGKDSVTEEVLQFLVDWLSQHTSIEDQDYKNYL